jgi:hypothetical protein
VLVIVPFIAAPLSGCGEGDGLPRVEVSGTVTFDGKPLPVGLIQFHPEASLQGVAVSGGAVIEGGRYQISREQGLTPGTYKVVILSHNNSDTAGGLPGEPRKLAPELIPPQYNVKTTLSANVTADGRNVFDFDLKK